MKKSHIRKVALILALTLALSVCALAAEEIDYGAKLDEALSIYKNYSLFGNEDTDYIRDALIASFEENPDFFYDFMNKIYEKNDRYSHYLEPTTYEAAYGNTNVMVGIGVVVSMNLDENVLEISSVTNGGPADLAGLLPGDKIVSVDDINVRGFAPSEAALAIRGTAGTTVKIGFIRGTEQRTVLVKRAVIALSDVSTEIIDEKIGYMKIAQFEGLTTFIDFIEAYHNFRDSGVNTIVLDLRNNRGGSLDCLINMVDNIFPEEVPYLMTWQAHPLKLTLFESEGYGWEFNKFVILVNENSASASEVLAGSMQELGYAVVVGKTTVGKGMGQRHIETSTGDEAVVSVVDLKLPVNGSYDQIGIIPDYKVDLKKTPYKLPQLTPLKYKSIASKIKTANVKALEERLSLLGYFYGTPDNVWDERTVFAVNMYCRYNDLQKISSSCSWELLLKIDESTKALEEQYIVEDTQLDKALSLAREYAKSDKKAKAIDSSYIDFVKN